MSKHRETYFVDNFPFENINRLMDLHLSHAQVRIHDRLWIKLQRKHPEALVVAQLHLDAALCAPDYVGQAPHHFYNLELIKRTPGGLLLVAVKIRDDRGAYCRPIIASTYLIGQDTLHNRIANGTLKRFR